MTALCPAEDCDGEIEQEIVGSWSNPDVKHTTTCRHRVFECAGCGEWTEGQPEVTERQYYPAHTGSGGPAGQYKTLEYCTDCVAGVSGE